MSSGGAYLSVPVYRPKVAFFEFTSCEGCQLQMLNNEATLLDFISRMEVINFREVMTGGTEDYEIAFVEGSITRNDEAERLEAIRGKAKVLVALGSCACFGGVNQLKDRFRDQDWMKKEVYGDHPVDTDTVRPISAVVAVDINIPGCPVRKGEVEHTIINIALGKSIVVPKYPVCMECRANENICLFDLGEPCLGPVTRAGCDSWCPSNRMGCWGCRGPAEDVNMEEMKKVMERHGISEERMLDRLECFGGFRKYVASARNAGETG